MNILEIIEESSSSLNLNKLRTALSALGIIIGIASVISLMSIGAQSKYNITKQIESLGANVLTLSTQRNGKKINLNELNSIKTDKRINTITSVSAEVTKNRLNVQYNNISESLSIVGIENEYFNIRNFKLNSGDNFNESDFLFLNKNVILGNEVAKVFGLSSNDEILNKQIKIKNNTFKVIGILDKKDGQFGGSNANENIYTTLNSNLNFFATNKQEVDNVYIQAIDKDKVDSAKNQVGFLMLEKRKIEDSSKADFRFFSAQDILSTIGSVTSTITNMLAGVAGISLLVGGIGVMNIMLVNVTERTKEIGLRKSLGAKKHSIILQFLIESVLITLIGGILGILLGILISYLFAKFMFSNNLILDYNSIILSFLVSSFIGLIFGIYPAKKASNLQPIEALRYE